VRILLDSHVLVWYLTGDAHCSAGAREAIEAVGSKVIVSPVSAWEIANKVRIGKWPEATAIAMNFESVLSANRFSPLPISMEHARVAGFLPGLHRDPFDRMLAAQAIVEDIPLITIDPAFRSFDVNVIW
jgi:PIN domain nuclease of toxin-antitoxin system